MQTRVSVSPQSCSPRSSRRTACPPAGRRPHERGRGESNLEVTGRLRTGEVRTSMLGFPRPGWRRPCAAPGSTCSASLSSSCP